MAVYKATYCYPQLSTLDIRVAATDPAAIPVEYIGCKIDSSNAQITGYSIRLMDENNRQIFPTTQENISPITELQTLLDVYEENKTNSGLNGTQLQVPFFQSWDNKKLASYNAIYYKPRYGVDHIIMDNQVSNMMGYSPTYYEKASSWLYQGSESSGDQYLQFNWSGARVAMGSDLALNRIILDGETIMVGETVLIAIASKDPLTNTETDIQPDEQRKSGLWIVSQRYNTVDQAQEIILKPIKGFNATYPNSGRLNANEMAVIKKGELLHNCVFKYLETSVVETGYFRPVQYSGLWCDIDERPIDNLQVDGRYFKWEITLYQGNPTSEVRDSARAPVINYSNIYEEWMDITLSAGTILGTTPERIQIANVEPSPATDKDVCLPSTSSGDIVLQGKFIDLTNLPEGVSPYIFSGTRVAVKNYDSAYGHVYPQAGDLNANAVGIATHCQFFEHSNNSEYILDTDMVQWGISTNVAIMYNTSISDSSYPFDDVNYSLPYDFVHGDTVLFTNQALPYQNGVYEYVYSGTGILYNDHVYHHFFRRAASYTTWAAYIGKIIFCVHGDYGGQNIESLAPAGAYTLWNPISSTSGDSALLFTQERPILLFPNKLGESRTYTLYCNQSTGDVASWTVSTTAGQAPTIDKQTVMLGDVVLFADGVAGRVNSLSSSSGSIGFVKAGIDNVETNEYVYILGGQDYGKHVYLWAGGATPITANSPNWDLYTARILKNSLTQTYVSPFIGLEKGMMLKLDGGHVITCARGVSGTVHSPKYMMVGQGTGEATTVNTQLMTTQWIQVTDVNKTVYCIRHNAIDCSSAGLAVSADGSQGLASYGKTDSGFPWTYEVRSHFATSNENSFYAFEQPYIRLYKDGLAYSGLALGVAYDFDVLHEIYDIVYDAMYVRDPDDVESTSFDDAERFGFIYALDETAMASRSVSLRAEYKQFNQISWDSYRWLLLNEDGEILQDTGNKYTGTIATTFYGLGNESKNQRTYYAVLFVTDEKNNTLRYIIKMNVGQVVESTAALPFSAEFDCQTHSVLLNYEDAGIVYPTYQTSYTPPEGLEDEYVYEVYDSGNPSLHSPWDGGLLYEGNIMYVTDKYNNLKRAVDYSAGSLLGSTDGVDLDYSKSIYYGVPYAITTPRDQYEVPINYGAALHLNSETTGQFYFDTKVKLDDNFCGEILAIDVEKNPNAASQDPVTNLDETKPTYFNNYIRFGLRIPDNFSGIASGTYHEDQLNASRTTVELFLRTTAADNASNVFSFRQTSGTGVYHWDNGGEALPTSVDNGAIKYYLQPQKYESEPELWTGEVEFFELSGMPSSLTSYHDSYKFYLKQYGGNYFGFFKKFLGNLNLVSSSDCLGIDTSDLYNNPSITFSNSPTYNPCKLSNGAPSYWVDNRKHLYMIKDVGSNFYGNDTTNFNVYGVSNDSDDMLTWPADDSSTYWNESASGSDIELYPTKWAHIAPTDDVTITSMVPFPRHPSLLSSKNFRITAQIYDVAELYDEVAAASLSPIYSYHAIDTSYTISFNHTYVDETENTSETRTVAMFTFQIISE